MKLSIKSQNRMKLMARKVLLNTHVLPIQASVNKLRTSINCVYKGRNLVKSWAECVGSKILNF